MDPGDERIKEILAADPVIAVVGASPNPARPSHAVMRYLVEKGFRVIPVRPKVREILGQPCYGSLAEIPGGVDIVVAFRKPEACPGVATEAVAAGAGTLWLQEGIVSHEAADIARTAGLAVVMDACVKVKHRELTR
ncbi:MAG: CoA-binding protein [Thermoleophilia bacterium]